MIVFAPWHRRPAVILVLLVILPPAGIPLMWMRFRWTHKTKVGVTMAATAWFAMVAWHGDRSRAESAAKAGANSRPVASVPLVIAPPAVDPSPVTSMSEEAGYEANALNRTHARRAEAPSRFIARLEQVGIAPGLVVSVARDEVLPDILVITVGAAWHHAIKQERLMAAQNLWKLWVRVNGGADDPDRNWIRLVDLNGNKVGGSGIWGGADITVADNRRCARR